MNDNLPNDELDPKKSDGPSRNRIVLWIVGAGVGVYLLGSGMWGIVTGG